MLIDMILDRKDGCTYDAHEFYSTLMKYRTNCPDVYDPITRAMDFGDEKSVKLALVDYILSNGYNPTIAAFICRVDWLENENSEQVEKRREYMRLENLYEAGHISFDEFKNWVIEKKLTA